MTALGTAAPSATVATLQAAELWAGDRVALRDVDVVVRPSDRIRVDGVNGAGKSILVAALVASPEPGDVGVLPQDVSMTTAQRDGVLGTPDRHWMLAILDHLGVDPDRVLHTGCMSP